MSAQRTLGSSGGKHCKSLEGNVWRNVVSTSKKKDLGKDLFHRRFISKEFGQCLICGKCKFLFE